MEELIKYFESLEARIAAYESRIAALEEAQQTNEAVIASLEADMDELKNRQSVEPQVIEKVVEKIVEKPVEVIKEVVVEKPVVIPAPEPEQTEPEKPESETQESELPEIQVEQEPAKEEPKEEVTSPKAMLYGKPVDDIRLAISLGDRFLYQRELFGQNAELMQRTLTELNELSSFDEAIDYISSRFQWDTESNSYQQFLVTLHRRFG